MINYPIKLELYIDSNQISFKKQFSITINIRISVKNENLPNS